MVDHEFGEFLGLRKHPREIKNAKNYHSDYYCYEYHHREQPQPVVPPMSELSYLGLQRKLIRVYLPHLHELILIMVDIVLH